MLIVSENNKAINLDNIAVMYVGVKNIMTKNDIGKHCVMCESMDGYTEIIKTCKTRTEAEDKYFNAFLDEYNKNMNNID